MGLEVAIGEWRICLPRAWFSLNEQTFFKSDPELGQFRISTARHTGGPSPDWGASRLREMLSQMAGKCGFLHLRNVQEGQIRQITIVCGDLDSNGSHMGRMWFASYEGGCLFATYFAPIGANPSADEEIAEAHEALLGVQVLTH